jgi:hypothetical protein
MSYDVGDEHQCVGVCKVMRQGRSLVREDGAWEGRREGTDVRVFTSYHHLL